MTTMQRFKAYFGMVPPSDYEDDYLDDGTGQVRRVRGRGYDDYYGQDSYGRDSYGDDGYDDDPYGPESYGGSAPRRERVRASSRYDEDERDYAAVSNGGYVYTGASRSGARGSARLEPLQRSAGSTLRAVGASAAAGHDGRGAGASAGRRPVHRAPSMERTQSPGPLRTGRPASRRPAGAGRR